MEKLLTEVLQDQSKKCNQTLVQDSSGLGLKLMDEWIVGSMIGLIDGLLDD